MKALLQKIGFLPKENSKGVFVKKYSNFDNYIIEVDFEKKVINYGKKIKAESKTTQNFSQAENWVVLECVNRLLEKGYNPKDLTLEKVYPTGHGTSGRLDILVKKNKKAYLMIECKTWGKEFEKEFKNLEKSEKNQLFTYFQQDSNVEFLILYTSKFDEKNNEVEYKNEIVKIEDHYRQAGNVKDFYDRWNKITKNNGVFEDWVKAYGFKSRALTKKDLQPLTEEDSQALFNRFASILRKHSVSDHPNAFNKIFNLFLAKIFDEKKRDDDELKFQWIEGESNAVDFQVGLVNLHKDGMLEFLKKEVEGIEASDFNYETPEDFEKIKKKWLKFNNIFAIKEVIDDESFDDNQRVLKEVVELLQKYQIRYPRKQQHLSNFFERLLTTGLKQQSGQFFTPPPVARYILKSLPVRELVQEKLNKEIAELPAIIDYACGSGHFLTEAMEEIQKIVDKIDITNLYPDVQKKVRVWREDQFDWAKNYVYGIEKDYRLVKVAKVGCYFYGDGLAQIIHGDGLDNFNISRSYRGLLKQKKEQEKNQDNARFDIIVSNPPYAVQHFKGDVKNQEPEKSFELFEDVSDQSSEIEVLFIERTKQLLREGGVAGVILPSSILNNTGLYTKAREIFLKYFYIKGITSLGSATFMATGTSTVVLFLERRNNFDWQNIQESVEQFFINLQDNNIKTDFIKNIVLEKPVSEYITHAWEEINFRDYISLCQKFPNEKIRNHEIFIEYSKKIKHKDKATLCQKIIEIEKEKILYFILAYNQDVVLTKTGEKKAEKQFLGYEFSNRRGSEGMHPTQRGKTVDECTSLFDSEDFYNPQKASTYVLESFENAEKREIDESLKNNVLRVNLVDMMIFDRVDFDKTISVAVKKKIKIESKWELIKLGEVCELYQPKTITSQQIKEKGRYKVFGANGVIGYFDEYNHEKSEVLITCRGATCGTVNFSEPFCWITGNAMVASPKDKKVLKKYLKFLLETQDFSETITGTAQPQITRTTLSPFKIPLPPKEIQEKIVAEIEVIEKQNEKNKNSVEKLRREIENIIKNSEISKKQNLSDVLILEYGNALPDRNRIQGNFPVMGSNGIVGWHNEFLIEGPSIIIGRKGSAGKVNWIDKNSFPIDTTFYVNVLGKNNLKYIYFVLKKIDLEKLGLGIGVPGLNRNDAYNLSFGFPSIQEQNKIVKQIERVEIDISKLESKIIEVPKLKEEVLKKYL